MKFGWTWPSAEGNLARLRGKPALSYPPSIHRQTGATASSRGFVHAPVRPAATAQVLANDRQFSRSRILITMRLPSLRLRRGSDPAVSDALDRIADRLDRLIDIAERTNQLLERFEVRPRRSEVDAGVTARPTSAKVSEATATARPTLGLSRRRTEPTRDRGRKTPRDQPRPVAREGPRRLHEAIIQVLLDAGEPLTANDIAARIRERNLFESPRSGHELRGGQVSARVGNATYRDRFVRRDGRIWLADPDGERRAAPGNSGRRPRTGTQGTGVAERRCL